MMEHSNIYCMKCKSKTKTNNVRLEQTKNGKPILKGICASCGSKKAQFIKKKFKDQV